MKKFNLVGAFMALLLMMFSCQKQYEMFLDGEQSHYLVEMNTDSSSVDWELAKLVAVSEIQKVTSRSLGDAVDIDDVSLISNKNGEPLIYVINYKNNKGYALVSATKNYYPLLVKTDQGRFCRDSLPDAAKVFVDSYLSKIDYLKSAPLDSVKNYRAEWGLYKLDGEPSQPVLTRSLSVELQKFILDSYLQWRDKGFEISPLTSNDLNLTEEQYENALFLAEMGLREDYMETSFLIRCREIKNTLVEPMLPMRWGQGEPYNNAIKEKYNKNYKTGCTVTAIAQVMKYWRKPATYDWGSMADKPNADFDYPDLSRLMLDIGERAKTKFGEEASSTTLSNAVSALRSFGYSSASGVGHNEFTVMKQLLGKSPVLSFGSGNEGGHTWVCDGMDDDYFRTVTYLMTLFKKSEGYEYYPHELIVEDEYGGRTFHMNWGWEGLGDGWYRDENLYVAGTSFNNKRKDIINVN